MGDEYRGPNPISSAWIIMSLLDFYKVQKNPIDKAVVMECSSQLLQRQREDKDNPTYYGSWENAYSSRGNGWIAEVLSEIYGFC